MYMKKKLNLAALLLAAALLGACGGQKQDAADTVAQTESAETENAEQKSSIDLADGVYTVDFKTDSSMFKPGTDHDADCHEQAQGRNDNPDRVVSAVYNMLIIYA